MTEDARIKCPGTRCVDASISVALPWLVERHGNIFIQHVAKAPCDTGRVNHGHSKRLKQFATKEIGCDEGTAVAAAWSRVRLYAAQQTETKSRLPLVQGPPLKEKVGYHSQWQSPQTKLGKLRAGCVHGRCRVGSRSSSRRGCGPCGIGCRQLHRSVRNSCWR